MKSSKSFGHFEILVVLNMIFSPIIDVTWTEINNDFLKN